MARALQGALAKYNAEHRRSQSRPAALGHQSGRDVQDLRIWHMQEIVLDLPGYAIGGLAVGEPTEVMYDIIEAVEPYMP